MNKTIDRLVRDFAECRDPFDRDMFPEERLVRELGDENKADYLSMFCTLDYNRSVDVLVEDIITLAERDEEYFYAPEVINIPLDELQDTFGELGFRYPNRDAKGWQENCEIITQNFSGDWNVLYGAAQYSAPTLVRLLRKENFKYLKGKKLAPFYCRVVHDLIHPLDNVWMLEIPVDVHIRRLSKDLFGDVDDDEIRRRWKEIGRQEGFSPHVVDGALWQIGYSWESWGEDYWEEVTRL